MTKHTSEPTDWLKVERPYEPYSESEDPEQWCRVLAWEEAHSDAKDTRIAELEHKLSASESIRRALNRLYLFESGGKTQIRAYVRIAELKKRIDELETELADEREKVERLRDALDMYASYECEKPTRMNTPNGQNCYEFFTCKETDRPRNEWCGVCNAREALAATEPKD